MDEPNLIKRLFNNLLYQNVARDNNKCFLLKDFVVSMGQPHNFTLQLTPDNLDDLENKAGTIIIYQHFGIKRAILTEKTRPSRVNTNENDVLDYNNIWALKMLAERFHSGRILVTTSKKLLNFIRMRNYLDFTYREHDKKLIVNLKGIKCPCMGMKILILTKLMVLPLN